MKKLLLLLALIGCAETPVLKPQPPKEVGTEPTKPTEPTKAKFRWDDRAKDYYLVDALEKYGVNLLSAAPADWKDFASKEPKTKEELLVFWGNILVEMAYYESNWKSYKFYKENFKDRSGKYIVSRGLFQLSLESGKGYRCPFIKDEDIHDDQKNIQCAVMIMNKLVGDDKRIAGSVWGKWKGGARYWAVLRGSRDYTNKALAAIKAANK